MKMHIIFLLLFCLTTNLLQAQVLGNQNYNNNNYYHSNSTIYQNFEPEIQRNNFNQITIKIRGLYNAKATKQIAVISITQVGETIEEANQLMAEKIENIRKEVIEIDDEMEFFVDMISLVPMYEWEMDKKLFNKRTYNEIPNGFEYRKNLHIGYRNSETIHTILAICAKNEVYDLVRVDDVSDEFEAMQDSLKNKTIRLYQKTLTQYEAILGVDLSKKQKMLQEGFNVTYPRECYQSYQAYAQNKLQAKRKSYIKTQQKNTTSHYVPVYFKNHHFVFNPELVEPAIQMVYELQVSINLVEKEKPKEQTSSPVKEFFIVTPEGELKKLDIK